jgi:hypothetical protein
MPVPADATLWDYEISFLVAIIGGILALIMLQSNQRREARRKRENRENESPFGKNNFRQPSLSSEQITTFFSYTYNKYSSIYS